MCVTCLWCPCCTTATGLKPNCSQINNNNNNNNKSNVGASTSRNLIFSFTSVSPANSHPTSGSSTVRAVSVLTAPVTRGTRGQTCKWTPCLTVLWRALGFLVPCPLRPRGDEARSHIDAWPSRPAVPQSFPCPRPSFRYDEMACLYCASMFLCCSQYVRELISLWLFLFPISSATKRIFLGWVKEVRTTKP
jgi:hypothetical protein